MADPTTGTGTDDLQFDRAIDATSPGALVCAKCTTPIRMYYYHVNGQTLCSACKQAVEGAGAGAKRAGASMLRAIAFGLGAAIAGAFIYYAVMEYLDLEIGFVAILIGFMVGKAIRNATAGRGSRRFQVLAAGLTYLAVAFAYAPFAIRGLFEPETSVTADSTAVGGVRPLATIDADAASTVAVAPTNGDVAAASSAESSADSSAMAAAANDSGATSGLLVQDTTIVADEELGGAGIAIALVGALLLVLALPVLVIFTSMPSGLISALIIGFGMHQAWGLTGGEEVAITGPFKVGSEPPPAAA